MTDKKEEHASGSSPSGSSEPERFSARKDEIRNGFNLSLLSIWLTHKNGSSSGPIFDAPLNHSDWAEARAQQNTHAGRQKYGYISAQGTILLAESTHLLLPHICPNRRLLSLWPTPAS